MVWQLWKSYTNERQDLEEWAKETEMESRGVGVWGGYVIYKHSEAKNKEKETSVKASIFLGFCGYRERIEETKGLARLSAAPA